MAKARRRAVKKKTLPPTHLKEPATSQGKNLDRLDGMDPPNHLMPSDGQHRLMRLLRKDEDLGTNVGAFVDPVHGQFHWHMWVDHPPTFCDPLVLEKLCREDPRIEALVKKAVDGKITPARAKRDLKPLVEEVFDEKLLPRIYELFAQAQPGIAEYLLARTAWVHGDE